jgi:hypothetical protein
VLELYRQREISSGKAAELLGLGREQFIRQASERGIPYFQLGADWILLDDLSARRSAEAAGLNVIGTLGTVLAAKRAASLKLDPSRARWLARHVVLPQSADLRTNCCALPANKISEPPAAANVDLERSHRDVRVFCAHEIDSALCGIEIG